MLRGYAQKQDYTQTDWERQSVDSIYVSLLKDDSIPVSFKMLRGIDSLHFSPTGELRLLVQGGVGKYKLLLNREGYEPFSKEFNVASQGQDVVYLRGLFMEKKREATTLDDLVVEGTALKMVMKGDTVVFDSKAFNVAEGATLDALVRQLPGAQLEEDGSITVNGKKVKSILLDGNDFFQGDPEIALKNLPAYTIDKIKVYDKAAKDDYLTHASQKLSDSPQDENIVMDIHLKKEFQMATVINIEGGYGPGIHKDGSGKLDNRYVGRTFLIGFGKKYRFSAFGNINNVKNTSRSSSYNKDWGGGWYSPGEMNLKMGGFDVFYKPSEKFETSGELQYSREDITHKTMTASTKFYDSGNIYIRSRSELYDCRNHLMASARLHYKGDNLYLFFLPSVDWFKSNATQYSYNVNFNRNPFESSRGAAIDSLFSLTPGVKPSEELLRSVTSSNYQSQKGYSPDYPDWLRLNGQLGATWSPKSMRGSFRLNSSIADSHNSGDLGQIYYQNLTDPAAVPARRQQWSELDQRTTNGNVSFSFEWSKRFMKDRIAHNLSFYPGLGWSVERNKNNKKILMQALWDSFDPNDRPLPSVTAPENLPDVAVDPENTVDYLFTNNKASASFSMNYRTEQLAPGDSTFNPSLYIGMRMEGSENFRKLHYSKPYLAPEEGVTNPYDQSDRKPNYSGNLYLGISSANKMRYLDLQLSLGASSSPVSMFTLVPCVNSSNPLNIYLGPDPTERFSAPVQEWISLNFYRYGEKSHTNGNLNFQMSTTRNAVAQTYVFDQATGITTYRPKNINGNWNMTLGGNYRVPFGHKERWVVNFYGSASHSNSVDYNSLSGTPIRSVVRTENVSGNARISYTIKNGTSFAIGGSTHWQYSTSPREGFKTISATNSRLSADINFYLPWNIEGNTNLNANFRRGYEDSAMNTNEWIWNVNVQKSILNGALTFKISAVDLLGQRSNVSYYVNAQGRTETWTNELPRYVMMTIAYKFNFTPKSLKSD